MNHIIRDEQGNLIAAVEYEHMAYNIADWIVRFTGHRTVTVEKTCKTTYRFTQIRLPRGITSKQEEI